MLQRIADWLADLPATLFAAIFKRAAPRLIGRLLEQVDEEALADWLYPAFRHVLSRVPTAYAPLFIRKLRIVSGITERLADEAESKGGHS